MPSSVWGGILFILMGLGTAWIGWLRTYLFRANRTPAYGSDTDAPQRMSPAEARLWLTGWMMGGLGMICFGVTTLRYARGQYVSVPASAPLIDHIVWVLVFVGAAGFFSGLLLWLGVSQYTQEKRERREDGGDS